MERRLPQFFFALSMIVLALMLGAIWQAGTPAWRAYQQEFHRLEAVGEPNAAAKSGVLDAALVIRQDLLPGLQRVDRCTTCHLGVEDPTMKNAQQPFTFHPNLAPHLPARFGCTVCHGGQGLGTHKLSARGTVPFWQEPLLPRLQRVDRCTTCHLGVEDPTMKNAQQPFTFHPNLAPHLPARFGCTVCHGGPGLGTDKQSAHGKVPFWQEPLLPKEYIRASCGRCHKEGEVPGVPELTDGRRLFETQGCRGCHKLNGVGGTVGPDLTEEGAVHRAPAWLERHFLDPNAVSRNSPMPNFHFTKEQARALTFYMLSLTSEQMATYYSSVRLIPSAGYGRQLFVEKNCIACHSIGGVGAKNGPDLAQVAKQHSPGWLDEQLVNPQLIYPGSTMPAYDLETNARKAILTFMASAKIG